MNDIGNDPAAGQNAWTPVAVTVAVTIALGAGLVAVVTSNDLDTYDRAGHAAAHLAIGLPAALMAVLAWRWWPRRLPSRLSTAGAIVLRIALVVLCVGAAAEVGGALSAADPAEDGLLHDIGLLLSLPSSLAVLAGLGLLLLGGAATAAVTLWRIASGRSPHAREGSGSMT